MAIFSTKKNTKAVKAESKETKPKTAVAKVSTGAALHDVAILRPRVTEKASQRAETDVYTFEVSTRATKHTIALAIEAMYKVTPVKVNIVSIPAKKVFVRGKAGVKGGGKKAYVFVKKGDKIDFA